MKTGNAALDTVFLSLSAVSLLLWLFFSSDGTRLHRLYLKNRVARVIVGVVMTAPLIILVVWSLWGITTDQGTGGVPVIAFNAVIFGMTAFYSSREYERDHEPSKAIPEPEITDDPSDKDASA